MQVKPSRKWASPFRRYRILCATALAMLATIAAAPVQAQSDARAVFELGREGGAVATKPQPGLLVFLIDASGSMDPARGGGFDGIRIDVPKQIRNYARLAGEGGIEVRVYRFSSNPARWSAPLLPVAMLTNASEVESLIAQVSRALSDKPADGTALFQSMSNVGSGLSGQLQSSVFRWSRLIMYSDGLDDADPRQQRGGTINDLPPQDRQRLQRLMEGVKAGLPPGDLAARSNHETVVASLGDNVANGLKDLFETFAPDVNVRVVAGPGNLPKPPDVWSLKSKPGGALRLGALDQVRTVSVSIRPPKDATLADLEKITFTVKPSVPGLASVSIGSTKRAEGDYALTLDASDRAKALESGGTLTIEAQLVWKQASVVGPSVLKFDVALDSVAPVPSFASLSLSPQAVRLGQTVDCSVSLDAAKFKVDWSLVDPSGAKLESSGTRFTSKPAKAGRYRLQATIRSLASVTMAPQSGEVPVWVVDCDPAIELPASKPTEGEAFEGVRLVDRSSTASMTGAQGEWRLAIDSRAEMRVDGSGQVVGLKFDDSAQHQMVAVRRIEIPEVPGSVFEFRGQPIVLAAEAKAGIRIESVSAAEGRSIAVSGAMSSASSARAIRFSFQSARGDIPAINPVVLALPGGVSYAPFRLPPAGDESRIVPRGSAATDQNSSLTVTVELLDGKGTVIARDEFQSAMAPFRVRLAKQLALSEPVAGSTLVSGRASLFSLAEPPDALGEEQVDNAVLRESTVRVFGRSASDADIEVGPSGRQLNLDSSGGFRASTELDMSEQRDITRVLARVELPGGLVFDPDTRRRSEAEVPVEVRIQAQVEVKVGDQSIAPPYVVKWDGLPPTITMKSISKVAVLRAVNPVEVSASEFEAEVRDGLVTLRPRAEYRKGIARVVFHYVDGRSDQADVVMDVLKLEGETTALDKSGKLPVEVDGAVALSISSRLKGARTREPTYEYSLDEGATWSAFGSGDTIPAPARGTRKITLRELVEFPSTEGVKRDTRPVSSFIQHATRNWPLLIAASLAMLAGAIVVFLVFTRNEYLFSRCQFRWFQDGELADQGREVRICWSPGWHWTRKEVSVPIPPSLDGSIDNGGFKFCYSAREPGRIGLYQNDRQTVSGMTPVSGSENARIYTISIGDQEPVQLWFYQQPLFFRLLFPAISLLAFIAAVYGIFAVYHYRML
jgi:hypothetical protein